MKLLIIDDEIQIREGIQFGIDWEKLNITEVQSCGDGMTGLMLLKRFCPDIVLCDVRMPGTDGLTFLQEAKKKKTDLKVIMISGYSDFEYLQKAIQFGAEDYELKPIKVKKIINTVCKARDKIIEERSTKEMYQKYKKSYDAALLQDILSEKVTDQSIINEFLIHKLNNTNEKTMFCCVLSIDPPPLKVEPLRYHTAQVRTLLQQFQNPIYSFELQSDTFMLLIPCIASQLYSLQQQNMVFLKLKECLTRLKADRISFCAGITGLYPLYQLSKAYQDATALLVKCHLLGRGTILWSQSNLGKEMEKRSFDIQAIPHAFLNFDWETVTQTIEECCEIASKQENMTIESLRHIAWYSIEQMQQIVQKQGMSEYLEEIIPISEALQQVQYGEDISTLWIKAARLCFECLLDTSSGQYTACIEKACSYIRQHYAENLTVQNMADHIQLSPNYFSALFKKETGQSFRSYLNQIRLEKAAILLDSTDLLVSEVADQTGFTNYIYFSQKFKKVIGCTPSEYRTASRELHKTTGDE